MAHQTLFWLGRHGHTTDSDKNIFRGDKNSALNKSGFLDAHAQKQFFAAHRWNLIFCSTMTRSIQTASIICDGYTPEQNPQPNKGLNPWDIGFLTGLDKTKYADDMKYYIDHPDETPKGGESRNTFQKRVYPLLIEAAEIGLTNELPCVVEGHSSIIHALNHLLYGENHPPIAVKPGGVIEVFIDHGVIEARAAFKAGNEDSSFSVEHPSS